MLVSGVLKPNKTWFLKPKCKQPNKKNKVNQLQYSMSVLVQGLSIRKEFISGRDNECFSWVLRDELT